MSRTIKQDYLSGHSALRPFYTHALHQPDFGAMVQAKAAFPTDRPALVQAFRDQYARLEPHLVSPETLQTVDSLGDEEVFTLTTGHQTVLMGGPLFTVYKVATIIRLARDLNAQQLLHPISGKPCRFVPVFWIHVEDHDYQEVNHFFSAFPEKHTYAGKFASAVGLHTLEPAIADLVPETFSGEIAAAWQPGRSLGEAYFRFAHALFGQEGCLILDATHPALKAQFTPWLHRELTEGFSHTALTATNTALAAAGYHPAIAPREVNLFWMDEAGRERIELTHSGFKAGDRVWSLEEMLALTATQPGNFSPNVVMRPLYQEVILPNLVYTGGWGEVGYWLQLLSVFEAAGVPFPLVLPRMGATIFRKEEMAEWREFGFLPEDIQKTLVSLYERWQPEVWDSMPFEQEVVALHMQFERLSASVGALSPTLPRSLHALRHKNERYLANTRKKIGRVIRNLHPEPFARIRRIKEAVQPDGLVQERVLSLAAFPDITPKTIVCEAIAACKPLDFTHQYLLL